MRLSNLQVRGLICALTPWLKDASAELRLYGSRVNDHLKGGDIDLLLLLKEEAVVIKLKHEKHQLLSSIKKQLGDQKIDLFITSERALTQDLFLKKIFPHSIALHRWRKQRQTGSGSGNK